MCVQIFNADETERTTVITSRKRKRSSHGSQVYYSCESTPSKCSKSVAEYYQPVSFDEEDEWPERKKRRTDNADVRPGSIDPMTAVVPRVKAFAYFCLSFFTTQPD